MILVDSSVWVDFFSRSPGYAGKELRRFIADGENFALTGLILSEVLQGLTHNDHDVEEYLLRWDLLEPSGNVTYREAAAIFRWARANGVTLTTIDTIIAAIALEHGATLFTIDKNFAQITRITPLVLHPSASKNLQ